MTSVSKTIRKGITGLILITFLLMIMTVGIPVQKAEARVYSTISDTFPGPNINTSIWTVVNNGAAAISNGTLYLRGDNGLISSITSKATYRYGEKYNLSFDFHPNSTENSGYAISMRHIRPGGNNYWYIEFSPAGTFVVFSQYLGQWAARGSIGGLPMDTWLHANIKNQRNGTYIELSYRDTGMPLKTFYVPHDTGSTGALQFTANGNNGTMKSFFLDNVFLTENDNINETFSQSTIDSEDWTVVNNGMAAVEGNNVFHLRGNNGLSSSLQTITSLAATMKYTLTYDFYPISTENSGYAISMRHIRPEGNNYWYAEFSTGGTFVIYTQSGGVWGARGNYSGLPLNKWYRVEVRNQSGGVYIVLSDLQSGQVYLSQYAAHDSGSAGKISFDANSSGGTSKGVKLDNIFLKDDTSGSITSDSSYYYMNGSKGTLKISKTTGVLTNSSISSYNMGWAMNDVTGSAWYAAADGGPFQYTPTFNLLAANTLKVTQAQGNYTFITTYVVHSDYIKCSFAVTNGNGTEREIMFRYSVVPNGAQKVWMPRDEYANASNYWSTTTIRDLGAIEDDDYPQYSFIPLFSYEGSGDLWLHLGFNWNIPQNLFEKSLGGRLNGIVEIPHVRVTAGQIKIFDYTLSFSQSASDQIAAGEGVQTYYNAYNSPYKSPLNSNGMTMVDVSGAENIWDTNTMNTLKEIGITDVVMMNYFEDFGYYYHGPGSNWTSCLGEALTPTRLKNAIDKIHNNGFRIYMYFNSAFVNKTLAESQFQSALVRDENGNYVQGFQDTTHTHLDNWYVDVGDSTLYNNLRSQMTNLLNENPNLDGIYFDDAPHSRINYGRAGTVRRGTRTATLLSESIYNLITNTARDMHLQGKSVGTNMVTHQNVYEGDWTCFDIPDDTSTFFNLRKLRAYSQLPVTFYAIPGYISDNFLNLTLDYRGYMHMSSLPSLIHEGGNWSQPKWDIYRPQYPYFNHAWMRGMK
ncbi:MAG: hypothetical protein FIA99_02830 [Ruminiclostridium sp.]|nr:hypothetical protein [Ruminiclostridium sp.]